MSMKNIKCHECKHLIEKKDAQEVVSKCITSSFKPSKLYFCPEHKKPYDKQIISISCCLYYKNGELVTEDGKTKREQKLEEENKGLEAKVWLLKRERVADRWIMGVLFALGLIIGILISLIISV